MKKKGVQREEAQDQRTWIMKTRYACYCYYYAFISRRTSGFKICSEALTRHFVQNKVNIKICNYAAAKNITK